MEDSDFNRSSLPDVFKRVFDDDEIHTLHQGPCFTLTPLELGMVIGDMKARLSL